MRTLLLAMLILALGAPALAATSSPNTKAHNRATRAGVLKNMAARLMQKAAAHGCIDGAKAKYRYDTKGMKIAGLSSYAGGETQALTVVIEAAPKWGKRRLRPTHEVTYSLSANNKGRFRVKNIFHYNVKRAR